MAIGPEVSVPLVGRVALAAGYNETDGKYHLLKVDDLGNLMVLDPLAKGQIGYDAADTPQTTTSATFVDMAGSSLSVVIPAGQTVQVLLVVVSTVRCDTAGKISYIQIDWNSAATVGSRGAESGVASQYVNLVHFLLIPNVTAGTYPVKLQKRTQTAGNTSTFTAAQLFAIVLPSST